MNKLRTVFFAFVGILASAMTTMAQIGEAAGGGGIAADNAFTSRKYAAIAAGIGFALAAGLGALGQGRIASSAVEGAARNPGAAGRIQTIIILGLVFSESLVIFTLVIMFAIVRPFGAA